MKSTLILAATALSFAAPAQAQSALVEEDKLLVLGCLEAMDNGTTWAQCSELMFQACIAITPATQEHADCLQTVRDEWSGTVQVLQEEVMAAVIPNRSSEVVDLMGIWTDFVGQKCTEVGAAKETGAESARLGCEISEMVGLAGEFAACLEGRSSADYCEIKE